MPGHGARYWSERNPLSKRRKYPVCRGELTADIVIIGGGLTGAMAACLMARAGLDVVLVEAERIGAAGTAEGIGAILPMPAPSFRATADAVGLRSARHAWKETRTAALDLVSTLKRLKIRCDAAPMPLIVNARTQEDAGHLRREQAARKAAGLIAPWITASAVAAVAGTDSAGGIKLAESTCIDPVRATLGLVRAAEQAGARVFERSPVRRTGFDRASAEVVLATGTIRTKGVYVATSGPGALFRQLRRHVREMAAFAVVTEPLTAAMKKETGRRAAVLNEGQDHGPWLRWLREDRALFAGGMSAPVPPRLMDRTLVQRTGQLMYELSLRYPVISGLPAAWSWPVDLVTTADGLPWIGPHRNYPFHFFAIALGWHGEALAWFAARAALRHFTDKARPADAALGFLR